VVNSHKIRRNSILTLQLAPTTPSITPEHHDNLQIAKHKELDRHIAPALYDQFETLHREAKRAFDKKMLSQCLVTCEDYKQAAESLLKTYGLLPQSRTSNEVNAMYSKILPIKAKGLRDDVNIPQNGHKLHEDLDIHSVATKEISRDLTPKIYDHLKSDYEDAKRSYEEKKWTQCYIVCEDFRDNVQILLKEHRLHPEPAQNDKMNQMYLKLLSWRAATYRKTANSHRDVAVKAEKNEAKIREHYATKFDQSAAACAREWAQLHEELNCPDPTTCVHFLSDKEIEPESRIISTGTKTN